MSDAPTFQDAVARLQAYWSDQGCLVWMPHNVEVGAGTMNPATFLRILGPEPWNVAYLEPSVRPDDARYGENPNRVGRHHQLQVILKPEPGYPQELYLDSLAAVGIDLAAHDVRFVEDNWESPALGAWGLGWEVWLDGLEITQFTYLQQAGSMDVEPVAVEITYGLDRILMALQDVTHFRDLRWTKGVTMGDLLLDYEVETSRYYFEEADVQRLWELFAAYEAETEACLAAGLVTMAHDYVLKCSHVFNVLDARGAVGVTERARCFRRMRAMARRTAESFVAQREERGMPLLGRHADWVAGPGGPSPRGPSDGMAPAPASAAPTATDAVREHPFPDRAADFVLELGTEELPVADVDSAVDQLRSALPTALQDARLTHGEVTVWGTPRRLAVRVADLAPRQEDVEETVVGPPASVAYKDGNPTRAAEGFAKSVGAEVEDLRPVTRGGEERVAAVRREAGALAADALADTLPDVCRDLSFPRSMRWCTDARFPRPLRWIVALHGDAVVPVEFAGVAAGRVSRGLRPAGSPTVSIPSASAYEERLADAGVTLDVAARRDLVRAEADRRAAEADGRAPDDPSLVAEVANLVEQPRGILGAFDTDYLTLPDEVLVTVMKKHQRYFPVVNEDGRLQPSFVAVANGAEGNEATIRHGNEAVLRARFADAAYFWHRDRERSLRDFTPELSRLTFQAELGSMLEKVHRLEALAPTIGRMIGLDDEAVRVTADAAALAKSDLATALVVELTSLQGVVGREYALRSGEAEAVAQAIAEHYQPRGSGGELPASPAGTALGLADRLDSLVGLFAVGTRPSGAHDPFGLRRSAMGITAILLGRGINLSLEQAVDAAAEGLPVDLDAGARADVLSFLARRLEQQLRDAGHRPDAVKAVLSARGDDPAAAAAAVTVVDRWAARDDWMAILTSYARCARLVRDTEISLRRPDPERFIETAERRLHEAVTAATSTLDRDDPDAVLEAVASLEETVNRFFDDVLVMTDDPDLRANRLALVASVADLPAHVADLSHMEGF